MEKRILGIDPGLATLGFGVITCNTEQTKAGRLITSPGIDNPITESVKLIDFGVIKTPAGTKTGNRLCTIYDDLHTVVQEYKPDLVAIEKLFFYRMSNTITVAQAGGVVMLVLAQHKVATIEFTPAQIKQALTGYGNADKHEVQEAVARELNLEKIPRPDDAADALAIALTAWFNELGSGL